MRALRRVQRATPSCSELWVGVLDDGKKTRWIQEARLGPLEDYWRSTCYVSAKSGNPVLRNFTPKSELLQVTYPPPCRSKSQKQTMCSSSRRATRYVLHHSVWIPLDRFHSTFRDSKMPFWGTFKRFLSSPISYEQVSVLMVRKQYIIILQ